MDETAKLESHHLSSPAAFVEGGIQDAPDDSCSICLEDFCQSDPSTVTNCKHEFHLQCILEWCQRSSQCPMCWQPISLKDPDSQGLLEAVERERSIRSNQARHTTIFHHPAYGEFELQHLQVGGSDAELEIIQQLAAAAAMGRAHHIARREGRGRSGAQGRPQILFLSTHPNGPSIGSVSASSAQRDVDESLPAVAAAASVATDSVGVEPATDVQNILPAQVDQISPVPSATSSTTASRPNISASRAAGQSTPVNQDRAGPSDFHSFSESLKSRLNAVSMRYKESITKSTRGWKEKLFSRNNSVTDLGSEVRREVNAGIATVSRMMERLEAREARRASAGSVSQRNEGFSGADAVPLRAESFSVPGSHEERVDRMAAAGSLSPTTEGFPEGSSEERITETTASTVTSASNSSAACAASSGGQF